MNSIIVSLSHESEIGSACPKKNSDAQMKGSSSSTRIMLETPKGRMDRRIDKIQLSIRPAGNHESGSCILTIEDGTKGKATQNQSTIDVSTKEVKASVNSFTKKRTKQSSTNEGKPSLIEGVGDNDATRRMDLKRTKSKRNRSSRVPRIRSRGTLLNLLATTGSEMVSSTTDQKVSDTPDANLGYQHDSGPSVKHFGIKGGTNLSRTGGKASLTPDLAINLKQSRSAKGDDALMAKRDPAQPGISSRNQGKSCASDKPLVTAAKANDHQRSSVAPYAHDTKLCGTCLRVIPDKVVAGDFISEFKHLSV